MSFQTESGAPGLSGDHGSPCLGTWGHSGFKTPSDMGPSSPLKAFTPTSLSVPIAALQK